MLRPAAACLTALLTLTACLPSMHAMNPFAGSAGTAPRVIPNPNQNATAPTPAVQAAAAATPASPAQGERKEGIQPEVSTSWTDRKAVTGREFMAVTPHPLATQAAYDILAKGGTATDAATAAAVMLTLVEPFASGIGGGGFMLVYDKKSNRVTSYDGRETAPASATPNMFLQKNGQPMEFYQAVVGGKSVGVPGLLRMLERAHKATGKLTWYDLIQPTAQLAEAGFPVSERLHNLIAEDPHLKDNPAARAYFYLPDGRPLPVGHILRNPQLAEAMQNIASNGAQAFYADELTDGILKTVNTAKHNPGKMTVADFVNYDALQRDPLCGHYRGYKVCGMAPPSAGGIVTLQVLGILEEKNPSKGGPYNAAGVQMVTQAMQLAYADRNQYIADPKFVSYRQDQLLAPRYLDARRKLLSPGKALGVAAPGQPFGPGQRAALWTQFEPTSTSQISIVDKYGNAVSLTSSIENTFGSRLMVGGFVLNNQLTDFAFVPTVGGKPVANRVEAGKRPRSSMSPTLVFDPKGRLVLVAGSPGGSRITPYVIKTLVAHLDWKMGIQEAISGPNFANLNGATELEENRFPKPVAAQLASMGEKVVDANLTSGINAVAILGNGTLVGGTDPRREGLARGR